MNFLKKIFLYSFFRENNIFIFFLFIIIGTNFNHRVLAVSPEIDNIMGQVEMPNGNKYDKNEGLIQFLSNLMRLATIIGGIWVMYNFIMAGFIFLSKSGDSAAFTQASEKITMSVVGLMIIAISYTIVGLISLIIFKDATYIINPKIYGPTISP